VVEEVYQPLGMSPGFMSSMRTEDDNWQGQAEGGYGIWWIPDDMAKLTSLLMNGGRIGDRQVLDPGLLASTLQQDPDERGVVIDSSNMYNNAFWATHYLPSKSNGLDCEIWVPTMQGVSGNVVALFPNGTAYYYFSDNREFTWTAALREANKLIPMCE
jgi:CubicO group peptidase (beta-lactamase class C family)